MSLTRDDENLAYHAARLLVLIKKCGVPKARPGIKGRTLLAKLDFFVRYPAFLLKAASILGKPVKPNQLGVASEAELNSVESHMVRYHYGPWDHLYYPVLAYLIGKGFITVATKNRVEYFLLTDVGEGAANKLVARTEYADIVQRADLAYSLFNKYSGTKLKDFVYDNFGEVVSLKINRIIGGK